MQLPTARFTFARGMPVLYFANSHHKYIRFQALAALTTKVTNPPLLCQNTQTHIKQGNFIRSQKGCYFQIPLIGAASRSLIVSGSKPKLSSMVRRTL
jgi:hypothetical protein